MAQRIGLILLLASLVSACQPSVTPSPHPTPRVLAVQHTITLRPLGETFAACAQEQPGTGLVVEERPAHALAPAAEGLALRWGLDAPTEGFAAEIGHEELVIAAHPDNPLNQITRADLEAIYNGELRRWPNSETEVQPWSYPAGEDIQAVFEAVVRKSEPVSSRVVYLAPDPSAMLEALGREPGAVGFLPRRWLNEQVKELPVDGLDSAALTRPIAALSNSEPQGPQKAWLLCVQAGLSE